MCTFLLVNPTFSYHPCAFRNQSLLYHSLPVEDATQQFSLPPELTTPSTSSNVPESTRATGDSSGKESPDGPAKATYYYTGLGSCGFTNTDDEYVVAISHLLMDPKNPGNPNNNPLCG
jgi:hypothetical protein